MFNLLLWPGPGLASNQILSLVSRSLDAPVGLRGSYEAYLIGLMFGRRARAAQHETIDDRASAVAHIQLNPVKFVGYVDETITFTALATDFLDRTIQGVKFSWDEPDHSNKLQIDDAGRATFLHPGLARIACRAGSVQASAAVLIRPNHRPPQSDADWRVDQASLGIDSNVVGTTSGSPGVGSALSSLLDKLAPTAIAQSAPDSWAADFGYDQLWSEPRNLVGSPRNAVVEPMALGSVFPEGSNFKWATPIINLGGRGLAANLTLYYNSRVWSRRDTRMAFDAITGWPAPGFSLGFGRLVVYGLDYLRYMWVEPDGTRHLLGTSSSYYGSGPFESTDGSHIVFSGNASTGGTLYYPNGTAITITVVNNRLLPTVIADRNGNYIQIAYKPDCVMIGSEMYCGLFAPMAIDYVTDTMNRVIQFQYDTNYRLSSITAPGFGGTTQNPVTQTLVQFDYQSVWPSYNFSGLTIERYPSNSLRLGHIYFPTTGTGYLPSYSQYGMVYNVSLRRQMSASTWPPGSPPVISNGVESGAVSFNYPTSGALTDAPAFTQRTEAAVNSPMSVYTYSRTDYSTSVAFSIGRPDGSTLYMSRIKDPSTVGDGLIQYSQILSSGQSYGYIWLAYLIDGGGSPQVWSVFRADDLGQQSLVNFDYDSHGNITNKREFGYQISGAWQVRRRTHFAYTSISNAVTLVTEADVYDGLQDTNDSNDALIAKSTYAYDNYVAMGGMENYGGGAAPPGHLSWYDANLTVRGNITGVTQWTDLAAGTTVQHLSKLDIFGNVVKAQVSCCQEKDLTNTLNTYWSQPESEMSGDPNGAHQTTSADFDFNTSLPNSATDAGGLITNYGYDAALNPSSVTLPTGASANSGYDYGNLSSSSSVSYDDGGVTKTLTTSAQYDGWGRVIQSVDKNNAQVNTAYDVMGRMISRTNPFTAGGTPGPATTFVYDALGRTTTTTLPGGNTVQNSYSGPTFTTTDQVNRKIQRISDGLGRLVTVNEQDATGALTQATNYSYNYFDQLTQVNQGGQLRSYKYDAMGRLLYERIPEQSPTINDGTGTYWSCKYTYTEFSAMATKQDARGVVTSYTYDSLHRVGGISYDTSAASGVAATDPVSFGYTSWGAVSSVNVGSGYSESYTFDTYNSPASVTRSILGRSMMAGYTTSYQYNGGSQLTQMTYPSGNVVGISYDTRGRLSAGGGAFSGLSYNVAGQVTGLTIANGVSESLGYDTNRMQLTSQVATKGGGATGGLMNLTYADQASAGQMGAGSTAGNAGQLMSISGTIGGTTESAAYTYDNLGRLVSSNQTSNGATAQRRFSYDRWGNRTGMWDAVSGGNQLQNIVTDGANHIWSVNAGNSDPNYFYDPAGNLVWAQGHSYTYDAENRLVSVDGGVTAQYRYDHQNRRVSKIIGASWTHYIWEGPKVIAEHDGNTPFGPYGSTSYGARSSQIDYVYAGSKLLSSLSYAHNCHNDGTAIICSTTISAQSYYLSDRLSTRLVLDGSGNVTGRMAHVPFGEDFGESGSQEKHHFTSYERDVESGTDYALNREYSQSTGRFGRPDPLASSAKKETPQLFNRYSYANNEPVGNHDPSGLILCPSPIPFTPCSQSPGIIDPAELDPCSPNGASYLSDGFETTNTDFTCLRGPISATNPAPDTPQRCDVMLPSDGDQLLAVITVFGEASPTQWLGTNQYEDGDKVGHPTGVEITQEILDDEALLIASVIVNRSVRDHESLGQVVAKPHQFNGLRRGIRDLPGALFSLNGSPQCEKLRRAASAMDFVLRLGVVSDKVNFRAVLQQDRRGRAFIRGQNGALRMAGTDFW